MPPSADVQSLVVRAAGGVAAVAAVVSGGVLAARRLAGAVEPAGPALLVGAVAAGIPLVLAADAARRAGAPLVGTLAARCGLALAVAALALPPRADGPAAWAAVAVALAATAWATLRPVTAFGGGSREPQELRAGSRERRRRPARREPEPGLVRQRFERRELPAGAERVRGRVVVAVPAGARIGYGHLGFCPAFAATPSVEVTTAYDGVEATVTAAEILPWGVRVECRLAEPAEEPLDIPVDLVASAAAAGS